MGKRPDQIGGGKPGPGRPKGSRCKRSETLRKRLEAEGYDPQTIVREGFAIALDPNIRVSDRIYAASVILPYMLPKLSAVDVKVDTPSPVRIRILGEGDE